MHNLQIQKVSAAIMFATIAIFACLDTSVVYSQVRPSDERADEIDSQSGVISGRVVADGQPVRNATVTLIRWNTIRQGRQVITDDDGTFQVKGLTPGIFSLQAYAPAYVSPPTDSEIGEHPYRIGDHVILNLIRGGVITGKVVTSSDQPLVGVRVVATMIYDANDRRSQNSSIVAQNTDDRGIYRLYALLPGSYVVSAGGGGQRNYFVSSFDSDVPTYAPSSTRDTATEITVRSGEETKDVDIRYRGEAGHSVSGRVNTGTNLKTPVVNVVLGRIRNGIVETTVGTSQKFGEGFEFDGVADGDYYVWAQYSPSPDESANSEPRRISVKGADVTGIELDTLPLPSISGQLILTDSQLTECKSKRRPAFDEILIAVQRNQHQIVENQMQQPYSLTRPGSLDNTGNFKMPNLLPGQYNLTTNFFAKYWYLQSVIRPSTPHATAGKSSAIDASSNWISLKLGDRIKGMRITLAGGAAAIDGKLHLDGEEKIPSDTYVHLIPAEPEKVEDVLRYFATPVESNGRFTLDQLPPGQYLLLAKPGAKESSKAILNLRRPDQTEERKKIRRQAEANRKEIELRPCQRLTAVQVTMKRSD